MYQIITLYTLKIHSVICQLYLNKAGKKTNFVRSPHLISSLLNMCTFEKKKKGLEGSVLNNVLICRFNAIKSKSSWGIFFW